MTAPGPPRRLRRSRSDAVLGGVCAGVARSAGLDPLLLRIAVVAVTTLTGGTGLVAYLAAWVLVPREAGAGGTAGTPGADTPAAAPVDPGPADDPAIPDPADLPAGAVPPPRPPLTAADDPATGDPATTPDERPATSEVRARPRRVAGRQTR